MSYSRLSYKDHLSFPSEGGCCITRGIRPSDGYSKTGARRLTPLGSRAGRNDWGIISSRTTVTPTASSVRCRRGIAAGETTRSLYSRFPDGNVAITLG
ncbi:hypothetical protein AVEN_98447-1 [Araneus ventricosus]|uniref:Uncharacterized protein n=1 Tax=Araneus ventricosus TaxID=182803 RepID=A0A4Y2LAM8_ARAVE|nr:hypothetical protein AVEN_98447-1 [Araneus ventricosus]